MKHFVRHGSLRQINQSWRSLITRIWLCAGPVVVALATNRRYLLWNVEKDTQSNIFSHGRAAHEPICVPCKVSYRGSIPRISIVSIWAQWKHGYRINAFSLQPPRCSINCFSRSHLNRREGIDPKSWMTVWFFLWLKMMSVNNTAAGPVVCSLVLREKSAAGSEWIIGVERVKKKRFTEGATKGDKSVWL